MHFDNGDYASGRYPVEKWHYIILALFEASDPVNLRERCDHQGWLTIQNKVTFLNYLVAVVLNGILSPWTVEYVCAERPRTSGQHVDQDPTAISARRPPSY